MAVELVHRRRDGPRVELGLGLHREAIAQSAGVVPGINPAAAGGRDDRLDAVSVEVTHGDAADRIARFTQGLDGSVCLGLEVLGISGVYVAQLPGADREALDLLALGTERADHAVVGAEDQFLVAAAVEVGEGGRCADLGADRLGESGGHVPVGSGSDRPAVLPLEAVAVTGT